MEAKLIGSLERLVVAVERIADALEGKDSHKPINVQVSLDGKTLAQSVLGYTLRQAARGSSSFVGGSLKPEREKGR